MKQGQWETEMGSKVQNNLFRGSRISQSYRNCENTLTRLRVQTRRYLLSLFETKVFAPEPRTCLILEFSFLLFSFFLFWWTAPPPPIFARTLPTSPELAVRPQLLGLGRARVPAGFSGAAPSRERHGSEVGGSSSLIRRRREMSSVLGLTSSLLGISPFPALGSQANN